MQQNKPRLIDFAKMAYRMLAQHKTENEILGHLRGHGLSENDALRCLQYAKDVRNRHIAESRGKKGTVKNNRKGNVGCLVILVVIIGSILIQLYSKYSFNQNCGTTAGLLAERYTVRTRIKVRGFIPIPGEQTYEVNYTYSVEGKKYQGSGTLTHKPVSRQITVYYDKRKPSISRLEKDSGILGETVLLAFFLVLMFLMLKTTKRNRNV
ncbi:hypothetical protein JW948_09035 [bacterium]|nr:hypothetical protein [bacterium]